MKASIYAFTKKELEDWLVRESFKRGNADPLWEGLYRKRISCFHEMEGLPKGLAEKLEEEFQFPRFELVDLLESEDGTVKFLFRLKDGNMIETVLMRHRFGSSVCVTSQVGCNMGCAFCASGQLKKLRNLTVDEMVGQVVYVQRWLDREDRKLLGLSNSEDRQASFAPDWLEENAEEGGAETLATPSNEASQLTHIVVMGIGEPFDNYDTILSFLDIVMDVKGLCFAPRKITVSTSGLAPRIRDFARTGHKVKLAISLHASNDEVRSELMPVNRVYPLAVLFDALDFYIRERGQRVSLEYIMIKGKTDSLENAEELIDLVSDFGDKVMVNLIPYNPVDRSSFERSDPDQIERFFDRLMKAGIFTFRRLERGGDVNAACGQLRSRQLSADAVRFETEEGKKGAV